MSTLKLKKADPRITIKNKKVVAPSTQQVAAKIFNSTISNPSGLGGNCDMSGGNLPQINTLLSNSSQAFRIFEELYATDWQAQKIIDLPVDDMLRKEWIYQGLEDDEIKSIQDYQERVNLSKVLREALRLERLVGGAAIFIGVASNIDDPAIPISEEDLGINSLRFLNTIPRYRVVRLENQTDPTKPNYGEPLFYFVNGIKIHRSRLLIFDGDPLLPTQLLTATSSIFLSNDGFGFPVLLRLYDSLMQATGSRQAAFNLIMRASTLVFSGDIQSQLGTVQGSKALAMLQETLQQINMFNAALLNNTPGSESNLQTMAANFGSVPELLLSYLQVLSAASDIPASRFLGQAPGGLDATGISDLENYYNSIAARQRHRLLPRIRKMLRVLLPSVGIEADADELTIEFPPLWNTTEVEQAQVRQTDTVNITSLIGQGLISDEQALEELKLRNVLMTDPENFLPPDPVVPSQGVDVQSGLEELRALDNDNSPAE